MPSNSKHSSDVNSKPRIRIEEQPFLFNEHMRLTQNSTLFVLKYTWFSLPPAHLVLNVSSITCNFYILARKIADFSPTKKSTFDALNAFITVIANQKWSSSVSAWKRANPIILKFSKWFEIHRKYHLFQLWKQRCDDKRKTTLRFNCIDAICTRAFFSFFRFTSLLHFHF